MIGLYERMIRSQLAEKNIILKVLCLRYLGKLKPHGLENPINNKAGALDWARSSEALVVMRFMDENLYRKLYTICIAHYLTKMGCISTTKGAE